MAPYKLFQFTVRGVLKNEAGDILMMQRSLKSKNYPGCWEFPGGKVDKGEHFMESLVREFMEEAGLDVVPVKILGAFDWDKQDYKIAYMIMLMTAQSFNVQVSAEHEAFKWMTPQELKKAQVSPPLVNFINTYL